MKKITELTAELAAPSIEKQGCTLWDVEYVKEGGTWYLRVLLDKEGGVDILDCEAISRELSDLLDEADPIEGLCVAVTSEVLWRPTFMVAVNPLLRWLHASRYSPLIGRLRRTLAPVRRSCA